MSCTSNFLLTKLMRAPCLALKNNNSLQMEIKRKFNILFYMANEVSGGFAFCTLVVDGSLNKPILLKTHSSYFSPYFI